MRTDTTTETAFIPTNTIDPSMKLFAAIAMVLVVVGHIDSTGFAGPYNMFPPYSFQVAAFVFISGYFYKPTNERGIVRYVAKKTKRLMVPLFLITLVYGCISTFLADAGFEFCAQITWERLLVDPLINGHQFLINMPMWFIAPLFFAEIANILIRRVLNIGHGSHRGTSIIFETVLFVFYLSLGSIAITLGGKEGLTSGWLLLLCRSLFFLGCLGMGRFYKAVLEQHDTIKGAPYYLVVLSVQILLITICKGEITYVPSWCKFPADVFLTYLVTMNGIAFILRISKDLGPHIGNAPAIRRIADNTYSIMCHHYFGFFLVSCLFAAVASIDPVTTGFDYTAFYEGMYFYYPQNLLCWALFYCVVAILFSVGLHSIWATIHSQFGKLASRLHGTR